MFLIKYFIKLKKSLYKWKILSSTKMLLRGYLHNKNFILELLMLLTVVHCAQMQRVAPTWLAASMQSGRFSSLNETSLKSHRRELFFTLLFGHNLVPWNEFEVARQISSWLSMYWRDLYLSSFTPLLQITRFAGNHFRFLGKVSLH